MRLTKLELLAFGHFRGHLLDFSSPGLHVVLGRNEAGKSTTLRAITGLLYGIEHKTQDAFSLSKPGDLRVGGTVESGSGERLRFQRRKGLSSTLLDPSDKPIDEAVLRRFLGGVTRETFVHAYGLDHDTLAEGARALLEGKGDLGESLFDASVGGGGGVQQLVAELDAEADRLFKPKASNPLLNEAIKAFNDASKKIRETQRLPDAYVAQEEGLRAEEARRESLCAEKRELELRRSRLARAAKRAPRERERTHLVEMQRGLGAVAQRTGAVESLAERFASFEHALDQQRAHRAEVERLGDKLSDALRRAQLTTSVELLRDHARAEERLKPLLKKRATLATSIEAADKEIRRAEAALARITGAVAAEKGAGAVDAAGTDARALAHRDALANALERARALGAIDERLHAEHARIERQQTALAARAAAAGLFEGPLEAFVKLRPPPVAAIAKLVAESDDLARRIARHDERDAELEREAARLEREAAKNEGDFAPPDAAALRAARRAREDAWRALRSATERADAELAFDRALREADVVADQMIAAADRVTALARLKNELEQCRAQRKKVLDERKDCRAAQDATERAGALLFTSAGIGACELRAMEAWVGAHALISEEYARILDERGKLGLENERRERALNDLRTALARITEPTTTRLDDLIVEARTALDALDAHKRARAEAELRDAERTKAIADHRTDLDERVSARAESREKLLEISAKIAELVQPLGLSAEATDIEVERAVDSLREVFNLTDKLAEAETRAKLAAESIAAFETDLARTVDELAPDLDRGAEPRVQARELFDRARRARECAQRLATVESLLAEIGEPGTLADDEVAIVADPDRAEAIHQELTEQIDELDLQVDRAKDQVIRIRVGLEKMREESNAAEAAAAAQHHLARVRDGAERWARVKLAAVILQREIERYREENQGPLLAASSKLFARLTLGRFAGIKAGFDDKDRPCLRCVRDDGKTEVDVAGLSDGTRDQLYLSLRLASLLRRAESTEPMPLILDDVLIQLDDQRAAAALGVLAEVSRAMQVLFFTHHARLVELAKDAVPASDLVLHTLVTTAAAAISASP